MNYDVKTSQFYRMLLISLIKEIITGFYRKVSGNKMEHDKSHFSFSTFSNYLHETMTSITNHE